MMLIFVLAILVSSYLDAAHGLDARWKLMWSDEFNGATLDTTKWTARSQAGYVDNGELEFNLPSQVSVAGGKLVITSTNQSYDSGHPYRSGYLDTSGKFRTTFGRWEVYAKLPKGKGMWPAHWMLSDSACWPKGAEIDIMELIGNDMKTVYGTYHFGTCCGCNSANGSYSTGTVDLSAAYHTYAVEWWPTNITWYIDNTKYHSVKSTSVNNGSPFSMDVSPHYWILNTAVGGGWPGTPDKTTVFPQYHYIDYVRVYGWQPCVTGCGNGCCNTTAAVCKCNWGYAGTNCEYQMQAKSFSRSLTSYDSSVEQIGVGNNGYYVAYLAANSQFSSIGLTFLLNNNGCPSGCSTYNYAGSMWASNQYYQYGNFSYTIKASNYPGTAVVIWAQSAGNPWEAIQLTITGNSPTQLGAQYWVNGAGTYIGTFNLGFDASQAHHKYSFQYTAQKITLYVDGKVIAVTTTAPSSFLQMNVQFQADPRYFGAFTYTGPAQAFMNAVSWNTAVPTPNAVC